MVCYAKGRRSRLVGRHTQDFLSRAAKRSSNDLQRKVFFIAAVCSDELIASLLNIDIKPALSSFNTRQVKRRIRSTAITTSMRIYLSALLVAISSQKAIFLEKTQIEENTLLEIWCWIYSYQPTDMTTFNDLLLPAYQQKGLDGLAHCAGEQIVKVLYEDGQDLSKPECDAISQLLTDDASAMLRAIL